MSGGGKSSQGVYAPLPQSISDTESEEELHISTTHPKIQQPATASSHNLANGKETMRSYHPLDEGDDHHINGFPGITLQDDVPIIKDGGGKSQMSPIRKLLFLFSILLCFLTIFVFLWVLPCDENLTCPAVQRYEHTSNWEKTYHGIELKSSISVVSGVEGRSRNLVFLFRGDIMNLDPVQEFPNIPHNGGGLISIVGNSGKVAWFIPQQRVPSDIDCGIIDVDNNGDFDCILIGDNGLLEAIHPVFGTATWHLHNLNDSNFACTSVDFPLILPDVDNDGIFDLATSCATNHGFHNVIVLVSGRTGVVIGDPLTISDCTAVHKMAIDKNQLISFICENTTFKESDINVQELYRKITNKSADLSKKLNPSKQHLVYGQNRETQSQRNIYTVHNRKLIVENEGRCPTNCNVTVQLIDQQSGKENLTWSHIGPNMYGMVPAILIFNDTNSNRDALKGHISGFILKFWQWNEQDKYKNEKLSVHNHSRKMFKNIFDGVVKRQSSWFSPNIRYKRNIPTFKNNNKASNISIQLLTERVVLITFNSTDIHIVNASQNEITQLCTNTDGVTNCQPDLNFQENSVLIADLDQDGSQELISYLSTYVNIEESHDGATETSWQLQSIVKVVRLEAELPKLYEAVSKY